MFRGCKPLSYSNSKLHMLFLVGQFKAWFLSMCKVLHLFKRNWILTQGVYSSFSCCVPSHVHPGKTELASNSLASDSIWPFCDESSESCPICQSLPVPYPGVSLISDLLNQFLTITMWWQRRGYKSSQGCVVSCHIIKQKSMTSSSKS